MRQYSEEFREQAVRKMMPIGGEDVQQNKF